MARSERAETRRGWTRWDANRAQQVLSEWERSGLSLRAFALKRGFNPERLRRWRRRLSPGESDRSGQLDLLPVVVTSARPALTVSFDAGWSVEVHELCAESAGWVAQLARGLEAEGR